MLKVLKSQDKSYLQTIKSSEDKKIEYLRSTLHLVNQEKNNQHIKFDQEDTDNQDTVLRSTANEIGIISDVESENEGLPSTTATTITTKNSSLIGKKRNRTTNDIPDEEDKPITTELSRDEIKQLRKQRKIIKKENIKSYNELDQRIKRSEKLGTLIQHMELHQQLLQKGRRVKITEADGNNPAVYVWKPERKR